MTTPTTTATFNYNLLLFGGIVLFSAAWYVLKALHIFKGPIREV